jgi:predicted DNA-binding transcriptional regulator YafY
VTPDTDKLVRQLSLVAYLMAERRASSARDVKQNVEGYYDMSDEAFARRFYADRAELSALGVPIRSQRDEFTGEELYTLRREQYFLPPLHLTDAELAALATGVYLLEGQFAYAEPLRLALQNLALGRPNPSEDSSPGVSLRLLGNGFTAEVAQRLQKIESAVSKQRTIVFPYWAIYSDEQSTRTMDPYSLFLRDGQWYLVGRDHDRDAIRTFRLSRIRGDVRFATRRERDFRIPAEFDATQWRDRAAWQLGETDEIATIRVSPSAAWLVERAASRHGVTSYQDDGSLVFETPFADARLLARWLLDLDGQAVPLGPPDLVDEVTGGLDRVARAHEGPAAPHAAPIALVERSSEPAGRGGESPVAPERFAVLQALMADLLAACGDEPRARIPAVPLAARYGLVPETLEEHLQLLNLVSFGGGCYAVYSELVESQTIVAVEKELYGDDFRQPARLSPLEAKALLLALDLIGPLVAADSGTPLATVRAKVEASFGGYSMQEAPEPGSSPLPEDVLSVLSSGVREHRVVRMEYLSRRGEGVGIREIEPHRIRGVRGDWYVDTHDRTAAGERTFRVDRIRSAELGDEVFTVRPGVGDRDDDELSTTAGTASVWFSPDVARWELEGRPDTIPLADGAALASVPYGSERWLATELCRYLGDAVLLEPEGLRVAVAARARELGAGLREQAGAPHVTR